MIKLRELIKEDCQCGNDCCSTKLNENVTNIDLPQGMEMGKIFTGHGFAFKKEELKEPVKEFAMNPSAIKKMRADFKKTGELPPHLKKFTKEMDKLKKKWKVKDIVVPGLEWMSDIKENLYNVDNDMKDGKFDEKNPQVQIQGYGILTLKTLGEALSRKFADLSKRAKKGEIENVHSVLNKSGVLQTMVKAYMDAKKELKSSTMKRKITMYKRKR